MHNVTPMQDNMVSSCDVPRRDSTEHVLNKQNHSIQTESTAKEIFSMSSFITRRVLLEDRRMSKTPKKFLHLCFDNMFLYTLAFLRSWGRIKLNGCDRAGGKGQQEWTALPLENIWHLNLSCSRANTNTHTHVHTHTHTHTQMAGEHVFMDIWPFLSCLTSMEQTAQPHRWTLKQGEYFLVKVSLSPPLIHSLSLSLSRSLSRSLAHTQMQDRKKGRDSPEISISLDTNQEGTSLYLLGTHTKHTLTATETHTDTHTKMWLQILA